MTNEEYVQKLERESANLKRRAEAAEAEAGSIRPKAAEVEDLNARITTARERQLVAEAKLEVLTCRA